MLAGKKNIQLFTRIIWEISFLVELELQPRELEKYTTD